MRIVTDNVVSLGWVVDRVGDAGLTATVILKGSFVLRDGASPVPNDQPELLAGDIPLEGEGKTSLKYGSDFAPFKPRTDILLIGSAHAPHGRPVPRLTVALSIGRLRKALAIVGDRQWREDSQGTVRASEPSPFVTMPLTYERAFGSPAYAMNPVGRGWDSHVAPNIENPLRPSAGPRDRPIPAGFGPLSPDWEPRRSATGTYDERWLKERWPWVPHDFDWGYFNAAPRDQQVDGYLRGDEPLEFENLHSQKAVYRSQLPGLRARAFVQLNHGAATEFREVPVNLDTVWIDMEAERLVLVWRGVTPVSSVKVKEIERFVGVTEPLSQLPQHEEEIRVWVARRVAEEEDILPDDPAEAAEEAAELAADAASDRELAEMEVELGDLNRQFATLEAEAEARFESEKARLIAEGYDPALFKGPARPQTVADVQATIRDQIAGIRESHPDEAMKLRGLAEEFDAAAQMEREFAELDRDDEPPPPTREAVQAAIADGRPLTGAILSGLDLSGLDLSGVDFSGAELSKADLSGSRLAGAQLRDVDLSQANLTGADLSGALLDDADLTGALVTGVRFTGASLGSTALNKLDLKGLDFSETTGEYADFSGSNLTGANFTRAKLPRAEFSKATLDEAVFVDAEIPSAEFDGARANDVNMEGADLTGLRASDRADFTGGVFRRTKANGSVWETSTLNKADFSRARLVRAQFNEASLQEAYFDRADLTNASFDDADLRHAALTRANLLRASFDRADFTGASLRGSNLYEAGFWETVFKDTDLRDANVKGTSIA